MPLLHRKHQHDNDSGVVGDGIGAEKHPHAEHGMTEDYVSASVHAAVSQAFRELTDPHNTAALTGLVSEQGGNVARQATTSVGRASSRITAEEAVAGSYDAVEKKWNEWWSSMPPSYATIFFVACAFVGLLLTGLLLALWRFVLFGLH